FDVAQLDFEKPDLTRFPCLRLCYEAITMGGTATIVLNAANEIAVQAFLDGRIGFTDIAVVIEQTLKLAIITDDVSSLKRILDADVMARTIAMKYIAEMS
ncbi:MAG: 1-deoxy-D-xylulose-5-phosphate reductoisomerase, partial [Gammaproteobacteria bacterium]|nr:1-deoxy-D-xylulose-5-phosphate reductoisomerase [Gammaproteobacteria bacterium]